MAQRRFDPSVLFAKNREEMVCACEIMTYEAGRDAAERQPSARRAHLLQILLQITGSG
jgi:hypothetical protein